MFRGTIATAFDHLPFFTCSIAFKLGSIILLCAYLNYWAFVPVGFYWISVLIYGYTSTSTDPDLRVPRFAMSLISIFMPVFYLKKQGRGTNTFVTKVQNLQYRGYQVSGIISFVAYAPALLVTW